MEYYVIKFIKPSADGRSYYWNIDLQMFDPTYYTTFADQDTVEDYYVDNQDILLYGKVVKVTMIETDV